MFSHELLSSPADFVLDTGRISEIFAYFAQVVDVPQKGIMNIAFLSDDEIQVLNREYRQIDRTTDVLSFHYFDDFSAVEEDMIAGEIIMSESRILAQASEHGHTARQECEILIIHGILHILGFDHEDDVDYVEMWKYESVIRTHFGLSV